MLILHNGNFITCNPLLPHAEAVAIDQGKIIAVGNNPDILALSNRDTEKHNLEGKSVIPGMADAHIHLEDMAFAMYMIDCETTTKEECLSRIKIASEKSLPGRWIRGHGWNHNAWDGCLPTADELDKVSPNNPVFLSGKSLHIAWINHLALKAGKIHANTPDPKGGRIERDIHGCPSGILIDNAIDLIEKDLLIPETEESINSVKKAQNSLLSMGITAIHNFDSLHVYTIFNCLSSTDDLKIHVVQSIPYFSLDEAILYGWKTGNGNDWLQIGPLKLFSDGALGSKTASMLKPYNGTRDECGFEILSEKEMVEIGQKAIKHGIGLAIHAIGDRANRNVINAFESLRKIEKESGRKPLPFRIEHLQVIDPMDLPRLSQIGIVASMQPIHATSDAAMADRLWGDRCSFAYAWRSISVGGVRLIFGSDAPVENPNPFWGIHSAVTRLQRGSFSPAWYPDQCISFSQALGAFTINPAIVSGQSEKIGSLQMNRYADLVILSANPELTRPEELYNIKMDAVMVAGNWMIQK